jgi:hypothetical protein
LPAGIIAGLPFFNPQNNPNGPNNTVVATAATATVPPLLSPMLIRKERTIEES